MRSIDMQEAEAEINFMSNSGAARKHDWAERRFIP
jgi:hypothetical protein